MLIIREQLQRPFKNGNQEKLFDVRYNFEDYDKVTPRKIDFFTVLHKRDIYFIMTSKIQIFLKDPLCILVSLKRTKLLKLLFC